LVAGEGAHTIAVDANNLYWDNTENGTIMKVAKGQGLLHAPGNRFAGGRAFRALPGAGTVLGRLPPYRPPSRTASISSLRRIECRSPASRPSGPALHRPP